MGSAWLRTRNELSNHVSICSVMLDEQSAGNSFSVITELKALTYNCLYLADLAVHTIHTLTTMTMFQNTTVCWVTLSSVTWDLDWTMCMTATTGCLLGTSWIHDVTSLLTTQTNNTDLRDITFVSGSQNKITLVVTMQLQFCKQSSPTPLICSVS